MEGHCIITFDKKTENFELGRTNCKKVEYCAAKWVSKVSIDFEFVTDDNEGCITTARRDSVREMASTFHQVQSNVDI